MGTNYYFLENVCDKCGCTKKHVHMGKYSWGWQFLFRGHRPEITTKKDWKELTKRENCKIENEYGEEVSFDEFWEMVEKSQNEERLNHYRICMRIPKTEVESKHIKERSHHRQLEYERPIWIDDEGYSFDGTDFL